MPVHLDIANTKLFKDIFRPHVLEFERKIKEERAAVAKKLLKMGLSIEQIADACSISQKKVRDIEQNMKKE